MPDHDWNAHYASGQIPWDSDQPDPALVAMVEAGTIPAGRTLDVGCGTGTNALWLAAHGFDTLGIDLSPLAIDRARARMGDGGIACRFEARDFLEAPPQGLFDFVFDRGCFHVFDAPEVRAGEGLLVSWVAPGVEDVSRIHLVLDVAHHGGKKGEIVCDVADTGSFEIPESLVTELVNLGLAGFPTILVTRMAGAAGSLEPDVALTIASPIERLVNTGVTSCTDDTECPDGTTCRVDLTCG